MAKFYLKPRAVSLRSDGKSIKEISKELKISTSTVSLWCRNVRLTQGQINKLEKNARDPYYGKRLKHIEKLKREKDQREKYCKFEGQKLVGKLSRRERLLVGVGLYWGEGFKKDKMMGFSNTDPKMIKFIIFWLQDNMGVNKDRLKVRVVINESHRYRIDEVQKYWSDITGIPEDSFYKPTFQAVKWVKTYEHPEDYFGVLRIRVLKSTDLLRKTRGMIEGLGQ